jgi:hypothetical protein
MAAQVALKRKQAAEDAIALGLRVVAGQSLNRLPQGPIWGPSARSEPGSLPDCRSIAIEVDDEAPVTKRCKGGKENVSMQPAAPQRFAPLELLQLLFPEQERRILELLLEGADGDILPAIENAVSTYHCVVWNYEFLLNSLGVPPAISEGSG